MLTRLALQSAQRAVQHGAKIQKIITERRQQEENKNSNNNNVAAVNEDAAISSETPITKQTNKDTTSSSSPTTLMNQNNNNNNEIIPLPPNLPDLAKKQQEEKETAEAIAEAQRYLQENIVPEQHVLRLVTWSPQVLFDILKTEKYWDDQLFIFPVSSQLEVDGPFSFLSQDSNESNNNNNSNSIFHRLCIIFGKGNILLSPSQLHQSTSTTIISPEQKTALSFCLQLLLKKNNRSAQKNNNNTKLRKEIFLYRGKELISYLLSIFGSDVVYKNDGFADNIFDLGVCHVILEKAGLLSVPSSSSINNNNTNGNYFLETATTSFGALIETCFPSTTTTTTTTIFANSNNNMMMMTSSPPDDNNKKNATTSTETHFHANDTILTCVNQTCTLLNHNSNNKNNNNTKLFNCVLSGLLFRAVSQYRSDFCKLQTSSSCANNNNNNNQQSSTLDFTVKLLSKTEYYCALMSFHGVFVSRNRLDDFMKTKWKELCLSRNRMFVSATGLYQNFITRDKKVDDVEKKATTTTTAPTQEDDDDAKKNQEIIDGADAADDDKTIATLWQTSLLETTEKKNETKIFQQNKNRDLTSLVAPQSLWNEILAPALRRILVVVEHFSNNNRNNRKSNQQDAAVAVAQQTENKVDESTCFLYSLLTKNTQNNEASSSSHTLDSFLSFCKNILKTGNVSPSQCIRIISKSEILYNITNQVLTTTTTTTTNLSLLDLALTSLFVMCTSSLLSTKIIYEVRAAVQVESHRVLSRERQTTLDAAEKLHHILILEQQQQQQNQQNQQQQEKIEQLEKLCKSIRQEISSKSSSSNDDNKKFISLPSSFCYSSSDSENDQAENNQHQDADAAPVVSTTANAKATTASKILDEVHSEFTCINSDTARIFSSGPSLQTLPRSDKSTLKSCLVVSNNDEEDGGGKNNKFFVALDYSQFELRVLAHLSGDQNLIQAFKQNRDVVSELAEELMGMLLSTTTSSTSSDNADNNNPKKKNLLKMVKESATNNQQQNDDAASTTTTHHQNALLSNALRSITKIIIYGIIFGIGDDTLLQRSKEALYEMLSSFDDDDEKENQNANNSKNNNNKLILEIIQKDLVDPKQVRVMFHRRFPQVKPWMDNVIASARNFGVISTLSGFTRKFFSTTTTSSTNSENNNNNNKKPLPVNNTKSFAYSAVARQAVATIVQGTAADILKVAISEVFARNNNNDAVTRGCNFALILALHDELVFSVRVNNNHNGNDDDEEMMMKNLIQHFQDSMKRAGDVLMKERICQENNDDEKFLVPLELKVHVGTSLGDMKKYY